MDSMVETAEEVRNKSSVLLCPAHHKAIFCSWNQTHAGTGRLSTSLPNMQSLPKGTKTIGEDNTDDEQEEEEEEEEGDEVDGGEGAGEEGKSKVLRDINIRDCFRPFLEENVFISADFNQVNVPSTSLFRSHTDQMPSPVLFTLLLISHPLSLSLCFSLCYYVI
jgi:hypothetical protein